MGRPKVVWASQLHPRPEPGRPLAVVRIGGGRSDQGTASDPRSKAHRATRGGEAGFIDDTSGVALPSRISSKVAVSDDGLKYAFASDATGNARVPPAIEVRDTSGASHASLNKLNLGNCGDLFEKPWSVSGLSFDSETMALVVGISQEPSLLAFDLTKGPSSSPRKLIAFAEPVRDWAHCPQASGLAVVTVSQVIVVDLAELRNEGPMKRWKLDFRPRSGSEPFSSVAFSASGSFLAVGDEGGGWRSSTSISERGGSRRSCGWGTRIRF